MFLASEASRHERTLQNHERRRECKEEVKIGQQVRRIEKQRERERKKEEVTLKIITKNSAYRTSVKKNGMDDGTE